MRLYQRFDAGFERMRAAYIVILSSVLVRRGMFGSIVPRFLRRLAGPGVRARRRLLPDCRRRRYPPAHACADRHADRGNRAACRRSREGHPCRSCRRKELDTILDNLGLPYSGINLSYSNAGTIGTLDGEIQMALNEDHEPTQTLHRQAADDPAAALSGRGVFLPAGRHRHADSELRSACGHRRADRRRRSAGQFRQSRASCCKQVRHDSRHGGHAHPAEARRAGDQSADGSHPPAATEPQREQCGAERADLAVGQLADGAGFLVQQRRTASTTASPCRRRSTRSSSIDSVAAHAGVGAAANGPTQLLGNLVQVSAGRPVRRRSRTTTSGR